MSVIDQLKKWLGPAPVPDPLPPLEPGPLLDALRTVLDPEVGIDIVSLGLIRSITEDADKVHVLMTLSTQGCPAGPAIVDDVVEALRAIGHEADVEVTFDPPWTMEDISPEGRERLAEG